MKQIIQSYKSGELWPAEVPVPVCRAGGILMRNRVSFVSAGTERMLVEFGKANLLQKARQQPDRVKQVLDKIRTDGLFPTLEAVFKRLDEPLPLGYCNAGVVSEKGPGSRSMSKRCANEGGGSDCVRSGVHVLQRMEFK